MLISANFGSARAGLETVGYQLLNADKSEYAARTTTGVTELGDGIYGVTVADATLLGRSVVWDTGEASEVYACETFPDYAVAGDEMTLTAAYDAAKTAATQTSVDTIDNFLDTEFPLLMKWWLNKLVRTDNGDGTITYVLYDDDNTTPLKTWVHTTATGTRAKAS